MFEWLLGDKRERLAPVKTHEAEHAELKERQDRLQSDLERVTDARLDALRAEARILGRHKPR